MTKAQAFKLKAIDQLKSTTQTMAAHQRSLEKSTRASKPKAATAPKPGKIDKIVAMMRRPKGASINDLTRRLLGRRIRCVGPYRGRFARNRG